MKGAFEKRICYGRHDKGTNLTHSYITVICYFKNELREVLGEKINFSPPFHFLIIYDF